jgi:hypothetical protein
MGKLLPRKVRFFDDAISRPRSIHLTRSRGAKKPEKHLGKMRAAKASASLKGAKKKSTFRSKYGIYEIDISHLKLTENDVTKL